MGTQGADSLCKPGKGGNHPCRHLDRGLPAPRTVSTHVCVVSAAQSGTLWRQLEQTDTQEWAGFQLLESGRKGLNWPPGKLGRPERVKTA